jgi:hypothetical protein
MIAHENDGYAIRGWTLWMALAGAMFVTLCARESPAQVDPRMAEGLNRALVVRTCTGCHDLSNLVSTAGRTRDGWSAKLDDMEAYGMRVTPEERVLILDYLATYLPP